LSSDRGTIVSVGCRKGKSQEEYQGRRRLVRSVKPRTSHGE